MNIKISTYIKSIALVLALSSPGASAQEKPYQETRQVIYQATEAEGFHLLNPDEGLEQSYSLPSSDCPMRTRLRVVGGIQLPEPFSKRGEEMFRRMEYLLDVVPAVMEFLYQGFQTFVNTDDNRIFAVMEEQLPIVGHPPEVCRLDIVGTFLNQMTQVFFYSGVMRWVDNDLLAVDVPFRPKSEQSLEERTVSLDIEHHRVFVCAIDQEYADGKQYGSTQPNTGYNVPFTRFRHFLATNIHNIVENENDDAYDHRYAQSTFADDGAQGSPDKEKQQARNGHGVFLVCLHLMLAKCLVVIVTLQTVMHIFHLRGFGLF